MSVQVEDKSMPTMRTSDKGSMRALVQEGRGSAEVLHIRQVPKPELIEGRVLVRMRAASVNALDWHSAHGGLLLEVVSRIMRQKPQPIRGVDLAGTVEAVGRALHGSSLGTRSSAERLRRSPSTFGRARTVSS